MSLLDRRIGQAFYGGFRGLRDAQALAIEPVLRGDDVLVLSPTGSGKTEAVTAPLVQRHAPAAGAARCTILYVTPTRALANDLLRRLEPPMEFLGLTAGIRHGERNDLKGRRIPGLLITTPESLDVMLTANEPALTHVQAMILDEVHLTYNTQRGFQLATLIRRLEQRLGQVLQVVGLSATVATATDIWAFFRPGHSVTEVRDQDSKPIDYHICEAADPVDLIRLVESLAENRKLKVLIFANSRREADRLGALGGAATTFGNRIFVHHSSLSRDARVAVEREFQEDRTALCIATSTLELGVDIGDVDLVVLFGRPAGWESFLQRIGRGNRRSDKTNVICVVAPEHGSPFLSALGFEALLAQVSEGRLARERPMHLYGAAVQQILSVIHQRSGGYQRAADLANLFIDWPHLDRPTIDAILGHLADTGYLIRRGDRNSYGASDGLHRLVNLRLIWGNFPDRSREVRLVSSGKEIGAIPASNLLRLTPGVTVRFAGRHWTVRTIGSDQIEVQPSRARSGIEVTYAGVKAPLDPTNLEQMLRLLESGLPGNAMARTVRSWFLDRMRALRDTVGWDRVPVARDGDGYHYFTFAGQVFNGAVARWFGLDSFRAGDVELVTHESIHFTGLPDSESALEPFAIESMSLPENLTIFQSLLPRNLLERELVEVWRKTAVHHRSLERLRTATLRPAEMDDVRVLCG